MWQMAVWIVYSIRLELTCEGLLVKLSNHYTIRVALGKFTSRWATESVERILSLKSEICHRETVINTFNGIGKPFKF